MKQSRQEKRMIERREKKMTEKTDNFQKQFKQGNIKKHQLVTQWNALFPSIHSEFKK